MIITDKTSDECFRFVAPEESSDDNWLNHNEKALVYLPINLVITVRRYSV